MILPTKHLLADRCLLGIGADILPLLSEPKTVSRVWDEFRRDRTKHSQVAPVSYSWFVLALDLLFMLGTIRLESGRLSRSTSS